MILFSLLSILLVSSSRVSSSGDGIQEASLSPSIAQREPYVSQQSVLSQVLVKRHDHHEQEATSKEATLSSISAQHVPVSKVNSESSSVSNTSDSSTEHSSPSIGHLHQHQNQHSSHHSHPLDAIPAASSIPDSTAVFLPLPTFKVKGGHSHSHGNSAPKMQIDEQVIFRGKGPDPLSYKEWDWRVGLGKDEILRGFIKAEASRSANKSNTESSSPGLRRHGDHDHEDAMEEGDQVSEPLKKISTFDFPLISVVDGRWRKLFDEKNAEMRREMYQDLSQRIGENGSSESSRHFTILILHVVTSIMSCFVFLPISEYL